MPAERAPRAGAGARARTRTRGAGEGAISPREHGRRPSLVDSAEVALRNWLAPGRHRAGDRLPPEHDVAAMLGISRGTLRAALARLEDSGEIVRRQGSGTFVGRVHVPAALGERLERLEPYSSLARRRGVSLSATGLTIERGPLGREAATALAAARRRSAPTIRRLLLANGEPVAAMFDVVHPRIALPEPEPLREALEGGAMVLDVLIELGLPIAFARTRVLPRLLSGRDPIGRELRIRRATAALELEAVIYVTGGEPVAYSRDVFAPAGLEVQVMRSLESAGPEPVAPAARGRGAAQGMTR